MISDAFVIPSLAVFLRVVRSRCITFTITLKTQPQFITDSLNLSQHIKKVLSQPDLPSSHPSIFLYISLLPSLQNLLTLDTICDMVLNPGPILTEPQYCSVLGKFLSRLDRSRDVDLLSALKLRINNMRWGFNNLENLEKF